MALFSINSCFPFVVEALSQFQTRLFTVLSQCVKQLLVSKSVRRGWDGVGETLLTHASARIIFTKYGVQIKLEVSPACIALINCFSSTQCHQGCAQVNQRDMRCETRSSSSVTVVHGFAGSCKGGFTTSCIRPRIWRCVLYSCWRLGSSTAPRFANPSPRKVLISCRPASARIMPTRAFSWFDPAVRSAVSRSSRKWRSFSSVSILRFTASLRRPSSFSSLIHSVLRERHEAQGMPPPHLES